MVLDMQVIRHQLQSCIMQRDEAAHKFQQCVGAISILEEQLKVIAQGLANPAKKEEDCGCKEGTSPEDCECEEEKKEGGAVMDGLPCEGEQQDGQVEQQEPVEASQE